MPVDELTELVWRELGATMRRARLAAGVSIRGAETLTGYSRGMLSLAENAKAHPSRDLVRRYDDMFAADRLLLSLYAEALTASLPSSARSARRVDARVTGDELRVVGPGPARVAVAPGARVTARWTLRNAGVKPWTGRRMERLGAVCGSVVLASARRVPVPDVGAGTEAVVECDLVAPERSGTYVGCWAMVDTDGCVLAPPIVVFSVVVG